MGYFSGSLAFECHKCMEGENFMRYEILDILPEMYFKKTLHAFSGKQFCDFWGHN